ncbi:MAG: phosphotransferase family protein [Deltaproteobacteria bacterium]|nr:phosphotransferase family protein [Deltaproteobacteria bacterium]
MANREQPDLESLKTYLEGNVQGCQGVDLELTAHAGGHSCETWSLRADSERWIMRRPPRGKLQPGASSMAREFRVMKALADSPVAVPRMVALCEDPEVACAPFLLMEDVDGVVLRDSFPDDFADSPARRAALGPATVETLAAIHSVDLDEAGLARHGRPTGFLQRNLELMTRQWAAVSQREVTTVERLGDYLHGHVPDCSEVALSHGDYKLDNLMWCRDQEATVAAVIDWEVSTIAPPLVDLGWLRGFWSQPGDTRGAVTLGLALTSSGGFCDRDELVDLYREATGRDTSGLPWFEAFAMWKIAIIMEASYSRFRQGKSNDPLFASLDVIVPALAEAGLEALASAGKL